jgi:hypothetical protein
MARGLTAFLTYTAAAAFLDVLVPGTAPTFRTVVLWAFAGLMPLGAVARFVLIYRHGAIPRRQQLL